jgi:hypothetical protein
VLETWFSTNNDIRKCLLAMKNGWIKNAFWDVNNKKCSKWCTFFNLSYLITLMAYLCSQWTPNDQIKYCVLDWSIYRLFVLYGGWKRDSIEIMIFVYVSTTCSIVKLKMRFETWITWNDVNGVSLFNLSHLITVMAHLWPQRAQNTQIKLFLFDWSIYRLLVLNTGWKCDNLQMIIYVNVCSTWRMVQIKTRF